MKNFTTLLLFTLLVVSNSMAQSLWKPINEADIRLISNQIRYIYPSKSVIYELDKDIFKQAIVENRLDIPMPDGSLVTFRIKENATMETALAAKYPQIKTYIGANIRDAAQTIHCDFTTAGFHAIIRGNGHTIYIDPVATNQTQYYIIYDRANFKKNKQIHPCKVSEEAQLETDNTPTERNAADPCGQPIQLRKYRIAVACTGEYSEFHGNTKAGALSAIVTTMNRINSVYERDLAIKFLLVAKNDTLIYLNPKTDPFSNDDSDLLIDESQSIITKLIGNPNFDIGHTMSTGGGGLAGLGVVCTNGQKASGITGLDSPIGDPFDIDYVAHEIGHQFGGSHTFNSSTGSCEDNRDGKWAHEVASGVTIMAYAGICEPQNLEDHSIDNFNQGSLEQIIKYSREANGNKCPVLETSVNTTPTITAGTNGFTIPNSTPFVLHGTAKDAEGDSLKYSWEEYDLGPQGDIKATSTTAPIFRPFLPTRDSFRIFPQYSDILNNKVTYGEVLPEVARTLKFRLTARDYRNSTNGGGGACWATYQIKVDKNGPFNVTFPTTKTDTLWAGGYAEIRWNVAATNLLPVNCQKVSILLSTDGGLSFTTILANNTDNDGIEAVLIPETLNSDAVRVKIEAKDNIFFNISKVNTSIKKATKPKLTYSTGAEYLKLCLPNVAKFDIKTLPIGGDNNDTVFVVLKGSLPNGYVANFSKKTLIGKDSSTLTVTIPSNKTDSLKLQYYLILNKKDSTIVTKTIFGISTELSDFAMVSPKDASEGVNTSTIFEWKKANNATRYDFQLASDLAFKNIIFSAKDTTSLSAVSPKVLQENKLYFWRAAAKNTCASTGYVANHFFYTRTTNCVLFNSTIKTNISGTGTPTVDNTIQVIDSLDVIEVSVPRITGSHQGFDELQISLVAPNNKVIRLFKDECLPISTTFGLNFDDLAVNSFQCPPNKTYQPIKPLDTLANLKNIKTKGAWKLRLKDTQGGNGGAVTDWQLRLCLPYTQQKPFVTKNIPFELFQNEDKYITNDYLQTKDNDNTAAELTYLIFEGTKNGTLKLKDATLGAGGTFTQSNIDNNDLHFIATKTMTRDSFQYIVQDNKGGFVGKYWFQIGIKTLGASEVVADQIKFYPNPASDRVVILMPDRTNYNATLQLYNAAGQIVYQDRVYQKSTSVDVQNMPSGLYFAKIVTESYTFTGKFLKK